MTDDFNTAPGQDRQSKAASPLIESFFKEEKSKKGKGPDKDIPPKLYREGYNHFYKNGFLLVLGGEYAGHTIYIKDKPAKFKGINFPEWFRPYRKLRAPSPKALLENNGEKDDFTKLREVFNSATDDIRDFWEPLLNPSERKDSPFSTYVKILNMHLNEDAYAEDENGDCDGEVMYLDRQAFDPSENGVFGTRAESPLTYVPAIEWFDEGLRELTFDDIFIMFPQAEREIFKLWLGRVGVGRKGNVPDNFGQENHPIAHTARMAVIILSKEAGIGKSYMTEGNLFPALEKAGFIVGNFRSTGERFGMREIVKSHIVAKDDVSEDTLQRFLKAEETKILITNGPLPVEEKFCPIETVNTRCSILLNSNSWSANYGYALDNGTQSRIKCITTYSLNELENNLNGEIPEVLKGCKNMKPMATFKHLAEKFNVSKQTLMLYALRLASDHFYKLITDNSSDEPLKDAVYLWTSRLRYRFKTDILNSFTKMLALSSAVVRIITNDKWDFPEFSFKNFYLQSKHLYFLSVDPSGLDFTSLLKEEWRKSGSTTNHPYQSLRDIRFDTLKAAIDWADENYSDVITSGGKVRLTENELVENYIKRIVMRDGFKLGPSLSALIESVNSTKYQLEEIYSLAMEIINHLETTNPEQLARIVKYCNNPSKVKVIDDWMINNQNYNPTKAEELRLNAWKDIS